MQTISSFRDPGGRVYLTPDRVFRIVTPEAAAGLDAFVSNAAVGALIEQGSMIGTRPLTAMQAAAAGMPEQAAHAAASGAMAVYEHDRIPFPSYPFEWAPEMLRSAGELTLQVARRLLQENLGLKDATPFNVLFDGPRPVFVDMLSIERRDARDPVWLPYAQFVRTFLLPLILARNNGLDLRQTFLASREGIEPAQAYRMASVRQRLTPPLFGLASMPAWLSGASEQKSGLYQTQLASSAEKARFVLDHLLAGAEKRLLQSAPDPSRETQWTSYAESEHSSSYTSKKKEAVASMLDEVSPACVLDAGCNTGEYSIAAAERGARVVAIDYDPAVAGRLWTRAAQRKLDILPLVANLAHPSPALGWRNSETASLLDRLENRFDCVFMLALIHHLLVTERVPLEEIALLASRLTKAHLLIEFVSPADEHFVRIARGRDALHAGLTAALFESVFSNRFSILRKVEFMAGNRCLYLMRVL